MKIYWIYGFVLFSVSLAFAGWGENTVIDAPEDIRDKQTVEEKLWTADELWMNNSQEEALLLYEAVIAYLPEEYEPFRSLIIMRLAYAHFNTGNKAECLSTLDQLENLEYIPEHHALAATEMIDVISGKPHPGYRRTKIPPAGTPAATIYANTAAGIK